MNRKKCFSNSFAKKKALKNCYLLLSDDLVKEWNSITNELQELTPEGQIRFITFDKNACIRYLQDKFKTQFAKYVIAYTVDEFFNNMYSSNPEYFEYKDTNAFCGCDIGLYSIYELIRDNNREQYIIFYANNINSNPNFTTDLISYFFKKHVLRACCDAFPNSNERGRTTHFTFHFGFIRSALVYFYGTLTENFYRNTFNELLNWHEELSKDCVLLRLDNISFSKRNPSISLYWEF